MQYVIMTYQEIQEMVAKADGYDNVEEWTQDWGEVYQSIYDLVAVSDMGFSKYHGCKYYCFERPDGKPAIWFKH